MTIDCVKTDDLKRPANRLSIGFLFVWTLCTGVSLAIDRWDFLVHADALPEELTFWTAYAFAFRPINGICLAFLLVAAKRMVLRQPLLPTAPGHWFLMAMGVCLLMVRTEDVLLLGASAKTKAWLSELDDLLRSSIRYAPASATALFGAIVIRHNAWWRLMLVSMTLNWILIVTQSWNPDLIQMLAPPAFRLDTLGVVLGSVAALVSIVAMIRDRRTGRRQDFYHWLGVSCLWTIELLSWPCHFWYVGIYG